MAAKCPAIHTHGATQQGNKQSSYTLPGLFVGTATGYGRGGTVDCADNLGFRVLAANKRWAFPAINQKAEYTL